MLAVVADGMGGHSDGARAAQAVVDTAARLVREQAELFTREPHEALDLLCRQAQESVTALSRSAHTTLVALWLYESRAYWIHVGDSRLYLFRGGRRVLRTRDHSSAQMLMELGEISEAEMASHPAQNRLYRSLGNNERPKAEIGGAETVPGDLFVLCSDGVWSYLSDSEFWLSASADDLRKAAAGLVKRAVQRGGARADNATLVLIRQAGALFPDWLRRLRAKPQALVGGEGNG
jgi:serine/threonine protein phosphatase PrpC